MLATELDHPGNLNSQHSDRTEDRTDLRQLADHVVPDVFVRYLRWRVSRLALSLVPMAHVADVALHGVRVKGGQGCQSISRMVRAGLWLGGRAWHEVRFQSVRQYRVQRVRLWLLRRVAVGLGQEWWSTAGRPIRAATWIASELAADGYGRARGRMRFRTTHARPRWNPAASGSASRSALSSDELRAALDHHEAWVASGWEVGKRAVFREARLRRADLTCALLADADLHGADLDRADLHQADLEGADLGQAKLRRANLHQAALRWADLRQADLSGADLEEANLKDADLHNANLKGARLGKAVLEHADLRGANLARAKGLTQAQLDGADADVNTRVPRGLVARRAAPSTEQPSCG